MVARIKYKDLKRIINATKKAVKNSALSNLMMEYVELRIEEGKLTATALDGHVIVKERADVDSDCSFKCYIKPNLPKVPRFDGMCQIELLDEYAYVTIDDITKRFKQPEGMFYKISEVMDIKKQDGFRIAFNPKLLKEALETMNTNVVVLAFQKDPKAPAFIFDKENNQRLVLPVNINSELMNRNE